MPFLHGSSTVLEKKGMKLNTFDSMPLVQVNSLPKSTLFCTSENNINCTAIKCENCAEKKFKFLGFMLNNTLEENDILIFLNFFLSVSNFLTFLCVRLQTDAYTI